MGKTLLQKKWVTDASDSSHWLVSAMIALTLWCLPLPGFAQAPDLSVWWSERLAPATEEALDESLYAPFRVSLRHRQTGEIRRAEDCFDTAELMERGYRPPADMSDEDAAQAYLCLARRIIAAAADPEISHLRAGPLDADDLLTLPAALGPGHSCTLRAVSHVVGNDWYSIARFFHVYMAGQKDDYKERSSLVTDPAAYSDKKLLVEQDGPDRLILTETTGRTVLERLGLGDINGDGIDDLLLLRIPADGWPQLAVLTKVRAQSLISMVNRTDLFMDFTYTCPQQAVTLVARKNEGCD